MNLAGLIQVYRRRNKARLDALLKAFKELESLDVAVKTAALGILPGGRRHPHQRRLSQPTLEQAATILVNVIDTIRDCCSFEGLMSCIVTETRGVRGFGELAKYDTTLRIGAFLGFHPTRVYLHAGVRKGAKALGLDSRRESLEVAELPLTLQELSPHHIENFLCIFKDELSRA